MNISNIVQDMHTLKNLKLLLFFRLNVTFSSKKYTQKLEK